MGIDFYERGLNLLIESGNDLASAFRLQFSFSTGAVVLFVHATADLHHMPVRTGILSVATGFFGFSAIQCIKGLIHLAKFKTAMGEAISRDVEKRGDLLRERGAPDIAGMLERFGKMDRFFNAGVAWSVLFMIVQFVSSFH